MEASLNSKNDRRPVRSATKRERARRQSEQNDARFLIELIGMDRACSDHGLLTVADAAQDRRTEARAASLPGYIIFAASTRSSLCLLDVLF